MVLPPPPPPQTLGEESATKFWDLIPLYVTITHSVHQSINPFPLKNTTPSFLPSPPLNLETVQALPNFLGNFPSILVFRKLSPKSWIFH